MKIKLDGLQVVKLISYKYVIIKENVVQIRFRFVILVYINSTYCSVILSIAKFPWENMQLLKTKDNLSVVSITT